MADIKPFTVSFPESGVADLKKRLAQSIYPDEVADVGWDRGSPLSDVERLANYWATKFDFQQAESKLNQFPHYTTGIEVDGFGELSVHFIHVKSSVAGAIPLLFSHGWPGSFYEGLKIIKPLTEGQEGGPAFDVVVPSLVNFGFSQGVTKKGFANEQHAETCHKLMLKLGYEKYVTQGGDWGWMVTRMMSLLYPSHVLATHFNVDVGDPPPGFDDSQLSARDRQNLIRANWFEVEGYGYNVLQSTKPQTLGYALRDSPLATLAWIYEKLHDWTDSYPWTDDEVCTWVSIYWFSTAGPQASVRLYYESRHDINAKYVAEETLRDDYVGANGKPKRTRKWTTRDHGTGVKIGQSHFPMDIHPMPIAWTRTWGNVVFERSHESGGHFSAWERPVELVQDLRDMFAKDAEAGKDWV